MTTFTNLLNLLGLSSLYSQKINIMPSPSIYVNIENMSYKGKEVFYKKPINTELHKAVEYNHHYEYYYKETETDENPRFLGKFQVFRKYRSSSYFDDYDYPIIVFEKDNIFEDKKDKIYCKGIPDSDNNKIAIKYMTYEGFPLYYQK